MRSIEYDVKSVKYVADMIEYRVKLVELAESGLRRDPGPVFQPVHSLTLAATGASAGLTGGGKGLPPSMACGSFHVA